MLVNEQDKKLMSLMTYLYRNNNKWLNLRDLMLHIKVSRKTLKSYIYRLEYMFSDLVEFTFSGSMLKINLDSKFGLLTMQRTFLNESLIINILKHTFFQTNVDKLDIAINFNVSETSIYRSIKFLNNSLEGVYNLQYSYSDLHFIGNEEEIRKFYINLFIETNPSPNNWAFSDLLNQESINIIIRNLEPYIHGKMYYAHFEYIKIGIAVSIIRLGQGFKIGSNKDNKLLLNIVRDFSKNKEIVNFIKKEFPNSKENFTDIMYQILVYFFSDDFLFFILEPQEVIGDSLDSTNHYAYYDESISYLIQKYKLTIKDKKELYNLILTYFKFKISNVDGVDFFVDHSEFFLNYVKFFNVEFYNDLSQILKKYLDLFHPDSKYKLRDLVYTTYTLWPDLIKQLIKSSIKPKVLIISHYDHCYAKSLESIISLWFENIMDVQTFNECEINIEKIRQSNYDIVIADFVINDDIGDK
ncbi:helix-turn-helix domain-containing protein, partial [Peptoniphilus asaccharolyticus]